MMMRLPALLWVLWATSVAVQPAAAEVHCVGDEACLVIEQEGRATRLAVRNLTPVPMTFTLYFTRFDRGLVADRELAAFLGHPSVTVTCPPRGETDALRLTRRDPRADFYVMFHFGPGSAEVRHDDSTVYELPFDPGTTFFVGQAADGLTHQGEHFHAVDWMMPEGARVRAARGGVVASVRVADTGSSFEDESYKLRTNFIRIAHEDGTVASYEHIRQNGATVRVGQRVRTGELIGYSGNVGYSSAPHLHFVVQSPINGRDRRSHPLLFRTAEGVVRPVADVRHRAPQSGIRER